MLEHITIDRERRVSNCLLRNVAIPLSVILQRSTFSCEIDLH